MANIIISYNRQNKAIARTLASDIEALGHTVWFDQELSGGQAWWDQILEAICNCDVFVFVLDPESLKSTACKREYGYAADLGKPILPILVAEGVSINLLPPALSEIQFVDYRKQDRDTAFSLAKALTSIPPAEPLPDPLPPPPEVPISYLGNLAKQIETAPTLGYEEQSTLVVDLKRSLRDPEAVDDARTLLKMLRKRRDLFAAMAEEIDELLDDTSKASSAESESQATQNAKEGLAKAPMKAGREPSSIKITQPPAAQPVSADTESKKILWKWLICLLREKLICSLCGAIIGTIVGVAAMAVYSIAMFSYGFYTGAGGAIAGAISGTNRRVIVSALVGAALGWFLSTLLKIINDSDVFTSGFAHGGIQGAPKGAVLGAILGAILFVILPKLKKWFYSG